MHSESNCTNKGWGFSFLRCMLPGCSPTLLEGQHGGFCFVARNCVYEELGGIFII